jgi:cytoskeletal protein RodZ
MSQQQPQHPAWGEPQQQGWAGPQQQTQPGWGAPAPQPPKKNNAGKIVGFGCLGIIGIFVLIGIVGAIASDSDSDTSGKGTSVTAEATPEAEKDDAAAPEKDEPAEEPAPEAPVKVTAKKTAFAPSILADGSNYTSVRLTITNNSDETISVNPLYFAITDSKGTKHTAELGMDEGQIDTVELAPGENVSGTVTGKGKFTAEYVTYTDSWFGDPIRADVS